MAGPRAGGPPSHDRPDEPGADPESVARRICLQQLERAPCTRAQLATTLARRGVPDHVAEAVLGRLSDVGLIDDALFARMWVASRHRGRGLAGRALGQELRRRGVDEADARAALDQLDPDQELATARALVQRRVASSAGLEPQARVRRLVGMLARKGYPAGLAFRVVREALEQEGQEVPLDTDGLAALE